MSAIAIMAAIEGATRILEALIPVLAKLTQAGSVTAEQQQALLNKIGSLRTEEPFTGPEWEKSGGADV